MSRELNPDSAEDSPFINPDPVAWIEEHFIIPETKGIIPLEPYQKACLRQALSRNGSGLFNYSTIIWSDVKKSAKSTIAAAVALWMAFQVEWGQITLVANDLKQVDSRVGFYIRRAIELNPLLSDVCKVVRYQITLPNRTIIESVPIDPSGEAGGNADMVVYCLDEQSEVLTKEGWKGWETLSKGDEIATRNSTGKFEWQAAQDVYCEKYIGEMIGIKHRSVDLLVTPDHRLFGKFVGKRGVAPGTKESHTKDFVNGLDNQLIEAEKVIRCTGYYPVVSSYWSAVMAKSFKVPATQKINGHGQVWGISQPEIKIKPELFAEFMGWYLSEGCTIKKRGRIEGFAIGQSEKNKEKRQRIIDLLREIGFRPRLWRGRTNIIVYHSEMGKWLSQFGLAGDKYIPDIIKNMPGKDLDIFLDAYIDGDGTKLWSGSYVISSKSKQMIDDLAEISQKCGYWITEFSQKDKRWKNNPIQHCLILKRESKKMKLKVEKKHWYKINYDGMVFCPSTKNGVIYIRRNGRYCWTGNSELWGAHQEAKKRMWAETTLPPAKFGRSFRWVETYAGYSGESLLLEKLYQQGTKKEHGAYRLSPDGLPDDFPVFANDRIRMFCMWNDQGRMPWHTPGYYGQEEGVLVPNEFRRLHKNEWVSSVDVFVDPSWWLACQESEIAPGPENDPWIVAMDAGVSGDNFALVAVSRYPENDTHTAVRYARKWAPPKGGKIDFQGTEESPGPEMELRRLIEEKNIIEVAYDPYQLEDMAGRLKKEGLGWFKAFSQAKDRLIADERLRLMIMERRIHHSGEHDLKEHIGNANAKIDPEERKIRIVKRSELLKVDLAVALSMANGECMRLNL